MVSVIYAGHQVIHAQAGQCEPKNELHHLGLDETNS